MHLLACWMQFSRHQSNMTQNMVPLCFMQCIWSTCSQYCLHTHHIFTINIPHLIRFLYCENSPMLLNTKKEKEKKKFLAIGNSEHPHQEPQIPLVSWEGSGNQSFPLSQEAHTIKESYFHKDFQSSIAFLVSSHPIIKSLTSPLKQIHLNLLQANYISSPL